jgi:hypothetical protein
MRIVGGRRDRMTRVQKRCTPDAVDLWATPKRWEGQAEGVFGQAVHGHHGF